SYLLVQESTASRSHVARRATAPRNVRNAEWIPTRRSSDLVPVRSRLTLRRNSSSLHNSDGTMPSFRSLPTTSSSTLVGVGTLGRSEEHTSELQSRENLVCLLLLEKNRTQHAAARDMFRMVH